MVERSENINLDMDVGPSPFERASSHGALPRTSSVEQTVAEGPVSTHSGELARRRLPGHKRASSLSDLSRQGSNPLKMGVPKRVPSLNTQVEGKCRELGGINAIHSVLVANNGIAAVKFIRSIRSWAYKTFGNERAVALVAMATPEDMRIDAEHIRMADQFVEVPGGSNNNNYGNVQLIVQVADRANVDAVWPGWGHASEKPELPIALSETPSGIRFLGPPAPSMAALGDKIGSTILAQAAGVPTIPWSGSDVSVDYESCGGKIPADVYKKACIHNLEEALVSCKRIGYPIMLKASWGGGGKGIRKVMNDDDVRASFKQVQGEVPGSPIFAMKLAPQSRHLEVQLICDEYGGVASIFSRDCSVQRRHQKIVEEGPVSKAPPAVLASMERCARALARSVGYVGAATVEYLYTLDDGKYFFLELNPRLQVEHPVTEWISGVNIPSCQLMIGMGVPLHRIPDIRRLFGKDPKGTSPIDYDAEAQIPPSGHVVAVRVTSEDANDGFKPTCGSIDELSFRTSPDVWGYFSVKSGGGIHEFSDSQFGHLFAKGDTREAAIRAMVVALKEVKIRGEIRTTVDYCVEMIQSPDFVGNAIHTGWLDSRIASHVRAEKPAWYLAVISGALLRTLDFVAARSAEYLGYLEKGQLPPARLTLTAFEEAFVLDGLKYTVKVSRRGPQSFRVFLGSSHVDVVARKLNDGGLLVQVDGQSHVVHSEEEALGTRLTIDSLTCLMANETDPSKLLAISPGKLMRYLVPDEGHVQADQPYAEIEVMKMLMPLLTPATGTINFQLPEGAVLTAGDLIAVLDLDEPGAVTAAAPYPGGFPELGPPLVHSQGVDYRFKEAYSAAKMILEGYEHPVDLVMEDLLSCLDDPALALLQWNEAFGVVQTRLPGELAMELEGLAVEYDETEDEEDGVEPLRPLRNFPAIALITAIHTAIENTKPVDRAALSAQCEPLLAVAEAHAEGKEAFARSIATELFSDFLSVEERFAANKEATEQEVIDQLRQVYSTNLGQVVDIVVSHQGVATKTQMVSQLMSSLVLPAPEHYRPLLRRLAALGNGCAEVAYRAQQLLEHSLLSELRAIVARALSGLDMFAGGQLSELDLLGSDFLEAPLPAEPNVLTRRPTVVEGLYSGLGSGAALTATQLDIKMKLLVEAPAAVEDALASLLDHHDVMLQTRALQTYVKRVYYPFLLRDPEIHVLEGVLCALWVHTHPTLAGMPHAQTSLSVAVIVPALSGLPAALAAVEDTLHSSQANSSGGTPGIPRHNHVNYMAFTNQMTSSRDYPAWDTVRLTERVDTVPGLRAGYESVSVLSKHGGLAPLRIGFWRQKAPGKPPGYVPDALLCAVEPPAAQLLELSRLAAFGEGLTYAPSRNRQCHLYAVTQRRDPRSLALKRVFVRGLVRQLGKPALLAATYKGDAVAIAAAAMEELESTLVDTLTQLERSSPGTPGEKGEAARADWAHVFLSVLPQLPLNAPADEGRVAVALRAAGATVMARYGAGLRRSAVAQWEVRLPVPDASGAWRLVVSSPTGHEIGEDSVQIYREVLHPSGELIYQSRHGKHEGAGPLHRQPILAPYPPLEGLQQKRLAARRHKTTYAYDFPTVFGNALRELWTARAIAGEPCAAPKGRLVEVEELVMPPGGTHQAPKPLVAVTRPVGQNDVGMVAWTLTMKTPECPQGRKIVAVANDITFNSGAFGTKEDAVFRAATEHALEEKLPLIYLAANAGARVGLAQEVKQCLQVEWNNPADPTKGYKFLYLSDADYSSIAARADTAVLKAEPFFADNGERRWRLTDVVGAEDGLGVECLSGSGAIASAYARAFRDGFTLTLVSGRTVGIGAYLARLGRRCIQRADQPIILTGYAALNKLLGREVYTSHMQLGGPKVMAVNGVSHHVVEDDLAGCAAVLQWLSFVPAVLGSQPPTLVGSDPVERPIVYAPGPGEKLDPRAAIAGRSASAAPPTSGEPWASGLFDRGSWIECQSGWARSVVTGRARLGGVPVGVIAVETQTVMLNIPADPGAPDSSERIIPQAGQVWFPDSALKTAHAMEEFDREGLPLFILANWRGFSGGQRDLFEGAGSLIVEALRTYRQPVTVYLPPGAELRGGAWVVVDGQINAEQVEMYADPVARGGVLEPEGIVEIKFRAPDLIKAMHRLDPVIARIKAEDGPNSEADLRAREAALLPVYRQVAVAFAEMHDTPVRMVAKGVLHGIVPWPQARCFLATRLRRRLAEEEIIKHITTTDGAIRRSQALGLLRSWYLGMPHVKGSAAPAGPAPGVVLDLARSAADEGEARAWADDGAFLAWAEGGGGASIIAAELKALRAAAASRAVQSLTRSVEGRDGLLSALERAIKDDAPLRLQLELLLRPAMATLPRKPREH
ncbi:hypothetical protein COCSUDRAFT_26470 [Coccomyxa subellipsoidea C-169]|uniref:Uncharacterized protein n=1 Tax=Coccomyxa subellipsoidea (strain C-169) TaxID=574566 RepID=I0YI54_COCSC|nr:hypothetical protein COCSUDRAFT_26470 [Coccomyxa subellipsoidea C-169]EIE18073.1 hypothetical protein COCSUDRAFT_26470 [Coccomyxa subellipsoidea C-169]|eukprot:XP_005642617.1 hypothetical protein COCSUDRAFT_26470 [Coccomyxa subellipsoidea C-169]